MLDQTDSTRAHLLSLWVAPSHWRLGIGRTLVEAIVVWVRTQNVRTMMLLVTSNNDTAIKFSQRLGFALTLRTEPDANDPALLNYEMSRATF